MLHTAVLFLLSTAVRSELAIAGKWADGWGSTISLSSTVFVSIWNGTDPSIVKITHYDNAKGYLVGQNSGPGSWYPGAWSRLDWVIDVHDQIFFCTTHYNAESEEAAMCVKALALNHSRAKQRSHRLPHARAHRRMADPSHDHAAYLTTGCNGFAFSMLSSIAEPPLAIAGHYEDGWGSSVTLDSQVYVSIYADGEPSIVKITYYDNDEGFLVGQNGGPGSWNPGAWSRIDWVIDGEGATHICTTHYNAVNESSAMCAAPARPAPGAYPCARRGRALRSAPRFAAGSTTQRTTTQRT
jgi:hypothetical protein